MNGIEAARALLAYRRTALSLAERVHIRDRDDAAMAEMQRARRLYDMAVIRFFAKRVP